MPSMEIVRFCAIEAKLQMSGELSVWWMLQAWEYAQEFSTQKEDYEDPLVDLKRLPTLQDVINIGRLVEPNVNVPNDRSPFRRVGVRVGWDIKPDWQTVPESMVNLMEALHEGRMTNEEWIKEYLEIHPWRDGNGRSSAIIYNWLCGTLDNPKWFPNFWGDPRRTVGFGA